METVTETNIIYMFRTGIMILPTQTFVFDLVSPSAAGI